MHSVELNGYVAKQISFKNILDSGTRIQLERKFSYSVQYGNNKLCKSEFSLEMFDKENPEKFSLTVILNGFYSYNPETRKEQIHIDSFAALFPFMKAIVANITSAAGIPPIMVGHIDIESENIVRYEPNQGHNQSFDADE